MNIELKPIAESKVRQMGGDVCGVLVRTDGGVMAVSEHGRCTRLDAGVMGPVEPACMSDMRDEFEKWFSDNHVKAGETVNLQMKAYMWVGFQAARTQGGEFERQCSHCGGFADYCGDCGYDTAPEESAKRGQGVPEGWRECLTEMVQAMHDYEMSVDEDAPYKHRAMMDRAHTLLPPPPRPRLMDGLGVRIGCRSLAERAGKRRTESLPSMRVVGSPSFVRSLKRWSSTCATGRESQRNLSNQWASGLLSGWIWMPGGREVRSEPTLRKRQQR